MATVAVHGLNELELIMPLEGTVTEIQLQKIGQKNHSLYP